LSFGWVDEATGPLPTFDMFDCCAAAFPEAVFQRVAQKFVRGVCTPMKAGFGDEVNRTNEPDPAAPKSVTGNQSCATRRETMSACSLDQL
jgi:hypothetical protein